MKLATAFLALSGLAFPALADSTVYPTGDPAVDVAAVRAAVEPGGTVLLKAVDVAGQPQVFDFGDFPVGAINWNELGSGYVALGIHGDLVLLPVGDSAFLFSIGNDVRLRGETVGEARTTIQGGTIPVRSFGPLAPGSQVIVFGLSSLSVENIRFTESALQSVYLTHLGSLPEVREMVEELNLDLAIEIRGNEFLDVKPALAGLWVGQAATADGPAGAARIQDNVVQFTRGRFEPAQRAYELANHIGLRPELWEGLTIADLHAPGELSGNQVQGVDVGLHVWLDGSDAVRIADNWLELRPEGLYGIAAEANHTYLIERNTVFAPGRFPDGISLWATDQAAGINHSTVRHNRIVMDGSEFGGITLYTGGTGNHFSQNVVEGTAAYALGLASPFLPAPFLATANTFTGNRTNRFTPRHSVWWGSGAHFLFDVNAIDNVLLGWSGIVKDLGEGNSATGWNRGRRGPSAALRARMAAKHESLRSVRPDSVRTGAASAPASPIDSPQAPAVPLAKQ